MTVHKSYSHHSIARYGRMLTAAGKAKHASTDSLSEAVPDTAILLDDCLARLSLVRMVFVDSRSLTIKRQSNMIIVCSWIILAFGIPYVSFEMTTWWTSDTFWIATLYIPGLFEGVIPYAFIFGALLPVRPNTLRGKSMRRKFRNLHVCLVTKGTNVMVRLFALSRKPEAKRLIR